MRGVSHRDYRASGWVNRRYPAPRNRVDSECRGEAKAGEVKLLRQRAFRRIQGQKLEESPEVVRELHLSTTGRIDRDAKPRRPLIGEGIRVSLSSYRIWAADQFFLLPTPPDQRSNILVYTPGVLHVRGVVVRSGSKVRGAKLASENLQRDRHLGTSDIEKWTKRAGRTLSSRTPLHIERQADCARCSSKVCNRCPVSVRCRNRKSRSAAIAASRIVRALKRISKADGVTAPEVKGLPCVDIGRIVCALRRLDEAPPRGGVISPDRVNWRSNINSVYVGKACLVEVVSALTERSAQRPGRRERPVITNRQAASAVVKLAVRSRIVDIQKKKRR